MSLRSREGGEKAIERNLLIPSGVAHLGGGGDQARELGGQHRSLTQAPRTLVYICWVEAVLTV